MTILDYAWGYYTLPIVTSETPNTTRKAPIHIRNVILSSRFRKMCANPSDISGFIDAIGETITKGAILNAVNVNATADEAETPAIATNKMPRFDALRSLIMLRWDSADRINIPTNSPYAATTRGGVCSVTSFRAMNWLFPYASVARIAHTVPSKIGFWARCVCAARIHIAC